MIHALHCFVDSLLQWLVVHWFTDLCVDSLTHCFSASLIQWLMKIHALFDSLLPWLTVFWLVDLLVCWFLGSLIQCSLVHGFSDSVFMHSLIHWFVSSLVRSICRAWFFSCQFVGMSTTTCSFVDALHKFNTSLILHLKKITYSL